MIILSGNKRRDEFTQILQQNNVHFQELIVYETKNETNELKKIIKEKFSIVFDVNNKIIKHIWLVFFSPSGIEVFYDYITQQQIKDQFEKSHHNKHILIATIGTTSSNKVKQYNWRVDAIAIEPNPQGLALAITNY